ncbi:hypothetical protein GLOTRDRAFT_134225 [Gloeophyllum trabeum ATCC 11539]|uniref:Uncharacterized protein n=1 Tax=Gloeophyllum trabeum (strain ATCC 11539 / FP-39264 / Madison 617) TaxID=670483 RepID=S7PRY6_GLOTA|nr:uncharacterized protein GLOTRDRAFT_134225 [Gloeophyllum trabeum ATCC 11539]EPQ50137.1 hypothetical protein GLOTRDRAFT_134225 [Gloeophyllum trabeum ATCC 11539]
MLFATNSHPSPQLALPFALCGPLFPFPSFVFDCGESPLLKLYGRQTHAIPQPMPYVGEDTILRFQDAFGRDDQSLRRVYASSLRSLYPHLFFTYEPRPHNIFVTESGQVFTSPSSTYLPPIPRRLSDENIPTVQWFMSVQWSNNSFPWAAWTPTRLETSVPMYRVLSLPHNLPYECRNGKYFLKGDIVQHWQQLEECLFYSALKFMEGFTLPLTPLSGTYIVPTRYGYHNGYGTLSTLQRRVSLSRLAFLPLIGMLCWAYNIRGELMKRREGKLLLEHADLPASWLGILREQDWYLASVPRAGVIVDPLTCQWPNFIKTAVEKVPLWIAIPPSEDPARTMTDLQLSPAYMPYCPTLKCIELAIQRGGTLLWEHRQSLLHSGPSAPDEAASSESAPPQADASAAPTNEPEDEAEYEELASPLDKKIAGDAVEWFKRKERSVQEHLQKTTDRSLIAKHHNAMEMLKKGDYGPVKARYFELVKGRDGWIKKFYSARDAPDRWLSVVRRPQCLLFDPFEYAWYACEAVCPPPQTTAEIYDEIFRSDSGDEDDDGDYYPPPAPNVAQAAPPSQPDFNSLVAKTFPGLSLQAETFTVEPLSTILRSRYGIASHLLAGPPCSEPKAGFYVANCLSLGLTQGPEWMPPSPLVEFLSCFAPRKALSPHTPKQGQSSGIAATRHRSSASHPPTSLSHRPSSDRALLRATSSRSSHAPYDRNSPGRSAASRPPPRTFLESDLFSRDLTPFGHHFRIGSLDVWDARDPKRVPMRWYLLLDKGPGTSQWVIAVKDALTAVQCLRGFPSCSSSRDLAACLLQRGIAFQTLGRREIKSDYSPRPLPPRSETLGLGVREEGYSPDYCDFVAYVRARDRVFADHVVLRAAFLSGGLPWRMALDSRGHLDISLVVAGPLGHDGSYGLELRDQRYLYFDDGLSLPDMDALSGVYLIKDSQPAEERHMAWFPSIKHWLNSGVYVGYWSHRNEEWYRERVAVLETLANCRFEEGRYMVHQRDSHSGQAVVGEFKYPFPILTLKSWKTLLGNRKESREFEAAFQRAARDCVCQLLSQRQ